jgi:hypothetical protein
MWNGLLVGAILSLLWLGAYHLLPLPLWSVMVASLAPIAGLLLGLILGGWRQSRLPEVARWVDDRQRLSERLSTALELSTSPEAGAWRDLVLSDAARHAQEIDPRRLLPFHLPKVTRWALVLLVLGAGLGFVPEYRSKSYLQKKADEQNIKEAGRQLAELTRRNLQKTPPSLEPTQNSLEAVANLGEQMAKTPLSRSEALKDLANVAEKLKDELRDLGRDSSLKRLEQAARSNSSGDPQKTAAGLQKQIESLQKQLGSPTGNPDALEKLQKELQKVQEAARAMADQNAPPSDAQKQQLSQSLAALSRQAEDMGLQLPELDGAIQALMANQTDMMLKDLKQATQDLEKLREMASNLQQLQQQMDQMGKDLAEQLKNGQPEAAQQTLEKMSRQLQSAQLNEEQLRKMLQEVSKAVDPASKYGQVAEHLKEAAKQMKSGEQAKSAQSLAKASDELKKLMQQMGDAESLQAALDALNQASMAIASGQGWAMARRPGFKPGGEPGAGVGTWAENEAAEWNGETTAGWDNSGIERDNMDPRGYSDRGEGELNEGLQPTKVRGQFSPGSQMPSITLKGVSIKGTSKVAFEEAAAAAQSDAQSALSQDKVPRAYQGAVKDYFDDLKK